MKIRFVSLAILTALITQLVGLNAVAIAANAADFKAGRIIDDLVFFNKSAMSESQIQTFLNGKVATCSTNHAEDTSNWRDMGPPYRCLKDYKENPGVTIRNCTQAEIASYFGFGPSDSRYETAKTYCWWKDGRANLKGQAVNSNAQTAAHIIWQAAQDYEISPKVILVTLQKEQSVITDTFPWVGQFQKAMGYACPDTGPCDPAYRGFYNQVRRAAFQFRRYATFPDEYNFVSGVYNNIPYSPNASCGTKHVLIENQATAGLYNYTPYTPNAAALNNLYGTGDSCSTYGNRNFWRIFTDWFGSTLNPSTGPGKVWRLRNGGGDELLTIKITERERAISCCGYSLDGPVFIEYFNQADSFLVPVYRSFNPAGGFHFYTTSLNERAAVENQGYRREGISFYAYKESATGRQAVFRLLNTHTGQHFFTASNAERSAYVEKGWKAEGVAWYGL